MTGMYLICAFCELLWYSSDGTCLCSILGDFRKLSGWHRGKCADTDCDEFVPFKYCGKCGTRMEYEIPDREVGVFGGHFCVGCGVKS